MINEILNTVSDLLRNHFGNEYTIYQNAEQQLQKPCFIITPCQSIKTKLLKERYSIKLSIDITYIPQDDDYNVGPIIESLYDILGIIETIDGSHRFIGFNMKSQIMDKIIHFYVDYSYIKNTVEEDSVMEDLEVERIG